MRWGEPRFAYPEGEALLPRPFSLGEKVQEPIVTRSFKNIPKPEKFIPPEKSNLYDFILPSQDPHLRHREPNWESAKIVGYGRMSKETYAALAKAGLIISGKGKGTYMKVEVRAAVYSGGIQIEPAVYKFVKVPTFDVTTREGLKGWMTWLWMNDRGRYREELVTFKQNREMAETKWREAYQASLDAYNKWLADYRRQAAQVRW
jgi:hypothetical protein